MWLAEQEMLQLITVVKHKRKGSDKCGNQETQILWTEAAWQRQKSSAQN